MKLEEAEIASKVQEIQEAVKNVEAGGSSKPVQIDMQEATVVASELLQAAKGQDVQLILDMGGYSWTINGKDIQASVPKDVDLRVTLLAENEGTVPAELVRFVAGQSMARQLDLSYEGDFGFKADLTLNLGAENQGRDVCLYYYDSAGRLVFEQRKPIDGGGNVSLSFSHASSYILVLEERGEGAKSPTTGDVSADRLLSATLACALCAALLVAVVAFLCRRGRLDG